LFIKTAKYKVGEFVDVNHVGNAHQITSCGYDESKDEFMYGTIMAKDGSGFGKTREGILRPANTEALIEDLTQHINELSGYFVQASKECEALKKRLKSEGTA
jgi:hypothetical protein